VVYQFQHSVDAAVSREAAWRFWTNVNNWTLDSDIEWVWLEGGFCPGSKGTTKTKSSDLVQWRIAEVIEGKSAVIEIALPGAEASFAWKFEDLPETKTRLTQTITFSGEQADNFATQMSNGFEQGIRQGMQKVAEAMERSVNHIS
jgi:Polyketide cyclase / dehydrase and lipid transport